MTPYVPTWKERWEEARPYVLPAVAGFVVLVLVGWLVWHEWLPRELTARGALATKDAAAREAAQARLSADVDTLEKTYQRAIESGAGVGAAALLNRAIERQRERLRLDPGVNPEQTARLARLETMRSTARAAAAVAQSAALENEVQALQQSGQSAGVADKLREALRLQREANANAAAAGAQDFSRETQLTQAIELAETEPLHATLANALALAHAAAAQEHWDDALKAYSDARAAQAEINQRHPTARYADSAALDQIDGDIASLQAAGLVAATAAREHDGDTAAAAGRSQEAAASYAAAVALQRQVNNDFPRSRFSSATHADELNVKRDTVLSAVLVARAAALDREIVAALARRQTVAAGERIAEASELLEKAAADFPRSGALDRGLHLKLGYLGLHRTDLDALQREIYERLAPLPGATGAQMLKTEVTQDLYALVMNTNPSRNPGRTLPVDSVSWIEAQEFCQRLSWLLGVRVRLPAETEVRAAFSPDGSAWSADTSGGHSHETGTSAATAAGFHDLAGNLAEWLQPVAESGELAPVGGGSYLDGAGALTTLPVTAMDKHERARHIGFRVVVESAAW